ncbi:MAG: hypothetical protein JSU96_13165 [Acidobacteriota bacterium]|nr:MAG: hypothetical protein JSU96_13165 [Acidobacteriota bacterium]
MSKKQIFTLAIIAVFCLQVGAVLAQEPFSAEGIPPESDFVYRKHYEQVQEIMSSALAQREAKLEAFMNKCDPKSKILQHREAYLGQIVQEYKKAGMSAQADALTQKMIKMFPKSDALAGQQLKQAYDSKNWPKVIESGEKLRASSPNDPQILAMLAEAYSNTKNNAKLLEISPKVVEVLGAQKAISYVVWLADHYRQKNDAANASRYYEMALGAYPSRAPQGWSASDWNAIKTAGLQLRAGAAWQREDFGAVINTYNEILQFDPKNDGAYLFMGLSYWKMQQLDQAQVAFARAVVLNKTNSARARQYLEQIYKPMNNDSLEGLDKLLDKAKADLGL